MTNTNIQGSIPLEGIGQIYRPSGKYGPGEYAELVNLEVYDNKVQTRRPIVPLLSAGSSTEDVPVADTFSYFAGFNGEFRDCALAVGWDKSFFLGTKDLSGEEDFRCGMYNTDVTTLPGYNAANPADLAANNRLLSFFSYNGVHYWLTHKTDTSLADDFNSYVLYYVDYDYEPWDFTSFIVSLTEQSIFDFTDLFPDDFHNKFIKLFIHKERVFIVTSDRIYFSKATDPLTWATPDGGFIDFESGTIYDAVALGDNIYIATDSKSYVFTYVNDPNTDGYLRTIFDGSRITALCNHNDAIFAATRTTLFQIINNNFIPTRDLTSLFAGVPDSKVYSMNSNYKEVRKLVSFGDSLIILTGQVGAVHNVAVSSLELNQRKWQHCFMFNTNNGSLSQVEFSDALDLVDPDDQGRIIDVAVPPAIYNQKVAYFAVEHRTGVGIANAHVRFYFMNEDRYNVSYDLAFLPSRTGLDELYDSTGTNWQRRSTSYRLRIENWAPDGSEYLFKKFRQILLEGRIPNIYPGEHFMDINVGSSYDTLSDPWISIDQHDLRNPSDSLDDVLAAPHMYRWGLNQRGKNLSVLFHHAGVEHTDIGFTDEVAYFELSDLRVLWSYTGNLKQPIP